MDSDLLAVMVVPVIMQRRGVLTLSSAGYGGGEGIFGAFCAIFRAPPGCPGVERQFFGALDGEEFFAIEGSPCQLAQDFVDMRIASLQIVS